MRNKRWRCRHSFRLDSHFIPLSIARNWGAVTPPSIVLLYYWPDSETWVVFSLHVLWLNWSGINYHPFGYRFKGSGKFHSIGGIPFRLTREGVIISPKIDAVHFRMYLGAINSCKAQELARCDQSFMWMPFKTQKCASPSEGYTFPGLWDTGWVWVKVLKDLRGRPSITGQIQVTSIDRKPQWLSICPLSSSAIGKILVVSQMCPPVSSIRRPCFMCLCVVVCQSKYSLRNVHFLKVKYLRLRKILQK